ncbi:MAG: AsnC family transcriptional regulator [Deltaproteobacteria bacterium]|nr:AsnC family transcriptional regulator [Deltaproteobacteria bacterium]
MDALDGKILNVLQDEFPLVQAPFGSIAERIGLGEDEVIRRIGKMKREGVIRRIGAVFDPQKLGFASTLCAARVPEERLPAFVKGVNALAGVTHNYRRNHPYNVWFTLTEESERALDDAIARIVDETGIADILRMKAKRAFKIDARFRF